MRKLYITILSGLLLGLSSCADTFLDLEPQDKRTNVVYFKKPADFKEYATGFYNQLLGWRTPYGKYSIYEFMDSSSDLAANFVTSSDVGRGTISISSSDERWDQCYTYIRTVNILFEKAKDYPGSQSEIAPYLAEAYFFRAYNYFTLLKAFGGV
ncbi:RagB/SusD family nutrient uptake outer membrane protein, partial [Bacteroides ovatus]